MYTVITENDESQWDDDTGILYHFPKRYEKHLTTGTKVIYYKGKIRNKAYSATRLSDAPHYFGIAKIGKIYADKESSKGDLFAVIEEFQTFTKPVFAKKSSGYLESIPETRTANYWRDGVRPIDLTTYEAILKHLTIYEISEPTTVYDQELFNDVENSLESFQEGEKKTKFVAFYERDARLRRQAIAIHGSSCIACGFNFKDFYGDYASGFIHVHHVVPVSDFGGSRLVNPETDLVPLCANCHSVVHRKKNMTLSVEDLKGFIAINSNLKTNI